MTYTDHVIATGDGDTVAFRLMKTYRSGEQSYVRPITKPVSGTVRIGVEGAEMHEGVHFDVDTTTGIVTLAEPPNMGADITAGFEFDVPVRFDTDHIHANVASFQAGEVPDVPVLEVRV